MTPEELYFENETRKHQQEVAKILIRISQSLLTRALHHDSSKLQEPEREGFLKATPQLKNLIYGSEEYKKCLEELQPTIQWHYRHNRHHPEFWAGGVDDMNLIDLIELISDWMAAVKRTENGSITKSLEVNRERFDLSDQLYQILKNTVEDLKNI